MTGQSELHIKTPSQKPKQLYSLLLSIFILFGAKEMDNPTVLTEDLSLAPTTFRVTTMCTLCLSVRVGQNKMSNPPVLELQ